jgi:hypothetical protein
MRIKIRVITVFAAAIAAVSQVASAERLVYESTPVSPHGNYTAHNGELHYWTAAGGYEVYDTEAGTTTTIGLPPNGTNTNGFGDAFGAYDPDNNRFFAATLYGASDSDVYEYDSSAGSWVTMGQDGVYMTNSYSGQVYGGQLYVGGLIEPWNGGTGQDNYIFAYDHSATPGGDPARHDTLIQTSGNSAQLAVAPNGDVYYGTYLPTNTLYRWSAAAVASVTDDLYAPGAVDNYLTIADADTILSLPGGGNGLAVDAAGNVFFAVNDWMAGTHILGMVDGAEPTGYLELFSSTDMMDWFGSVSVDGDFLNGGTLFFSPSWDGRPLTAVSLIPEPASLALFALAGTVLLRRRYAWRN